MVMNGILNSINIPWGGGILLTQKSLQQKSTKEF